MKCAFILTLVCVLTGCQKVAFETPDQSVHVYGVSGSIGNVDVFEELLQAEEGPRLSQEIALRRTERSAPSRTPSIAR
jgi:hypothetical protein